LLWVAVIWEVPEADDDTTAVVDTLLVPVTFSLIGTPQIVAMVFSVFKGTVTLSFTILPLARVIYPDWLIVTAATCVPVWLSAYSTKLLLIPSLTPKYFNPKPYTAEVAVAAPVDVLLILQSHTFWLLDSNESIGESDAEAYVLVIVPVIVPPINGK